jgi:carboxymethylenebutenolidase
MRGHPKGERAAPELSRRQFVVGSLAVGFAAAVRPVVAQTVVTTDSVGLDAGEVVIPAADTGIPGYRAGPAGGKGLPVVLVVQEIFGVHEHIKDVCRRLAKLGYLAAAPSLYARQGDVTKMTDVQQILTSVVSKVPDAQVLSDLDATVAWAEASGEGDAAKLGITGFCWGGRIVWLYAAHSPRLKAGVAWYGRLTGPKTELHPLQPIDVVENLRAPVLGLYGGADTGIPRTDIDKMRAALAAAGKTAEIVVYPEAPHGFYADYRPSYRPQAARDGWRRLQDWFEKYGVA